MTKPSGDYFKDKAEAVEYYRNNDDSLVERQAGLAHRVCH